MRPKFVAGIAPIVADATASYRFYAEALGLELAPGDYVATNDLPGVKHFGLWNLSDAAQSCFEKDQWPEDVPVPQASIEFDVEGVDAVAAAAAELESRGLRLLCGPKEEPWGQTVVRLLSPEGLLIGVTFTPSMHEDTVSR